MVTSPAGVQRDPPKDLAGVLDESANTLFMTELVRGMMLTLKAFFDKKYTVRPPACAPPGVPAWSCVAVNRPAGLCCFEPLHAVSTRETR
jgi:hypothetical protein